MKLFQTSGRARLTLSLAAFVALGGLAQAPAQAQTTASPPTPAGAAMPSMGAGSGAAGAGSHEMHRSMMGGMDQMHQMKMTGDPDKDFAAMMKMHHQHGVEMAKAQLQHGKSPELKAMARKIVKDQNKEIAQLDAWIKKHP